MSRTFLVFLFLGVAIVAMPPICSAEQISLVWATDNTPGGKYIVGGGDTFQAVNPGVEIELYRLVAKKLNINLQLKRTTWKGCLRLIKNNMVDGIFPASFKKERLEIGTYPMKDGQVDVSKKTRNNGYALYTLRESPMTWDGMHFHNTSGAIAVPSGWAIVDDMRYKDITIQELNINRRSPDLLLEKRFTGFICLESVFDSYLSSAPLKYAKVNNHRLKAGGFL